MLRMPRGQSSKQAAQVWQLVVFSIGGTRLAARAEEVGGVWPWPNAMPVPSTTPFVSAVLRHGEELLPVYDLAGRLSRSVVGVSPLCLIAKRQDGPMAICIDDAIPSLVQVEPSQVRPHPDAYPDLVGVCQVGSEDVPVYSLTSLGLFTRPAPQDAQT